MSYIVLFFFFAMAEPASFTIGAGGDVGFGRYLKSKRYRSHGGEVPFSELQPLFSLSDLVFLNLETPLSDVHPPIVRSKRPLKNRLNFRADTRYAQVLRDAGVDVVSLANNHMEDCGKVAIETTSTALDSAEVKHVGAHLTNDPYKPIVFQKNGVDIVVFARSTKRNKGRIGVEPHPDIAYVRAENILSESLPLVSLYREKYPKAVFLFSMHWGGEYMDIPVRIQRKVARKLIKEGIHVVLGHHPHVLQPVEVHPTGVILYSMGNLLFDQPRTDTHKSAFFTMNFIWNEGWRTSALRIDPLQLYAPPKKTYIGSQKAILQTLFQHSKSKQYKTPLAWKGDSLIWKAPAPQK